MNQLEPALRRPGGVTAAKALMVLQGLPWLYGALLTGGSGGLPEALLAVAMLGLGCWTVIVAFLLGPARRRAHTAALAAVWAALAVELTFLGWTLYSFADTSDCPPEGCEPIEGFFAFLVTLLLTPPLLLALGTLLLLNRRRVKAYLTGR